MTTQLKQKKEYTSPVLVDLGTAVELTAGSLSNGSEATSNCNGGNYWKNSIKMHS